MNKDYNLQAHNLLKNWLCYTTCGRRIKSIFWQSNCARFVIFKHHGHSEYIGRMYPSVGWCKTYYSLYDLNDAPEVEPYGKMALKMWEGRWNKKYFEDEIFKNIGCNV